MSDELPGTINETNKNEINVKKSILLNSSKAKKPKIHRAISFADEQGLEIAEIYEISKNNRGSENLIIFKPSRCNNCIIL